MGERQTLLLAGEAAVDYRADLMKSGERCNDIQVKVVNPSIRDKEACKATLVPQVQSVRGFRGTRGKAPDAERKH